MILDQQHAHPSKYAPLDVTSVRVERLQEITEEDAIREGCTVDDRPGTAIADFDAGTARDQFRNLWDSINGKTFPWASNPWVWSIGFKVAK